MDVYLNRTLYGFFTLGELSVEQEPRMVFTLEDPVRERLIGEDNAAPKTWEWKKDYKIPNRTAIPSGKYELLVTWSNKFQRMMPLIVNVPDYTGIRIHMGSHDEAKVEDTEGCVLVGESNMKMGDNSKAWLTSSREAFDRVFNRMQQATRIGKVWITITNQVVDPSWSPVDKDPHL